MFWRKRKQSDFTAEIEAHLELETERLKEQGLSEEEARRAARRAFGNVTRAEERFYEAGRWMWWDHLIQDLRFGLRLLAKNPGFATVAVLTLALGIGANTAIFSLIDAVMLKMLPVRDSQQLTLLNWAAQSVPGIMPASDIIHTAQGNMDQDKTGRMTSTSLSYPVFELLRARSDIFSSAFAFANVGRVNFGIGGEARLAEGELVSGDYFSGLGVVTVAGRAIGPADDKTGAAPVAMISYGYWETRFGRDRSAVGRSAVINNVPVTIIGVSPPEFFGLQPGRSIDVWLPLHTQPEVEPNWTEKGRSNFIRDDDWWVMVMGRLKPGVSEPQARAVLGAVFYESVAAQREAARSAPRRESAAEPIPSGPQGLPSLGLAPASKGLSYLRQEFSKPLLILMGVVGLVLLIACANVANLLLSRAAARQREIAVRLAIGAGRSRIIRQLLTESVMLASLGGTLGLLLAYWATGVLIAFMSSGRNPIAISVSPNLRALALTALISIVTGILFGLAPAYRAARVDLTGALKDASSLLGRGRLRLGFGKALVVSQVAMSLLLLVGAGLFVRTLENLEEADLGFDRRNVLLFGVDATEGGYKDERLLSFYQELQQGLEGLAGVRSAASSGSTLIGGGVSIDGLSIEGRPAPRPDDASTAVYFNDVGPRFFETMGIPLILGRTIGPQDTSAAPKVAVINEMLAHKFFAGSSPVGHRFGMGDSKSSSEIEIVGVVANAKYDDVRKEVPPTVYVPYAQHPGSLREMHFEIRTAGDPSQMVPAVRRVLRDLDQNLPLSDVKTQVEQINQTIFQESLFAKLSSFFGLLALTLTSVGLYGILAYAVARRTNEIGIRMALGAERAAILWMVSRESMTLAGIGIIVGAPAALAASRLVASMLYGLKPTDPLTIASAAAVLAAVALLAGYLPARRASRLDPMVALRYE
ncbi:MAG TPA: ABC transporter permease [Terriglobia bacterium]